MNIPTQALTELNSAAQARLDEYIAAYRRETEEWLLTAIAVHYHAYRLHGFTISELPLDIHAAAILEGLLDE